MGPKTKKNSKTSFYFFLNDYIDEQRALGRKLSAKIAAEECGKLWKDLPVEEKHRYGKLAAFNKQYTKDDKTKKYTSIGKTYAEVEAEMKQVQISNQKAEDEMKTTIGNLDYEAFKTHLFYIVHCNYYCKTDRGLYVPGEIAISEFNLRDGIRNTFHTLVNPGTIPLGCAYETKKNIEETHNLPYPPYEEGDSDYLGILHKILHFIEPGKLPNGDYPPLYCIEKNIKVTSSILKTLSENTGEDKNFFRVYHLHKMFFLLTNKSVAYSGKPDIGFPVQSTAELEVNKDIFCYTPGISCDYHAMSEEKYYYCSLSVVQRYVYLICDHCCQYVDIKLIPKKHCRDKCDTERTSTVTRYEPKSYSDESSNYYHMGKDSDYDGKSSYCGGSSVLGWGNHKAGSFLHDELESKFDDMKVTCKPNRCHGIGVSDGSDDEDWPRLPLGRGGGFFKK